MIVLEALRDSLGEGLFQMQWISGEFHRVTRRQPNSRIQMQKLKVAHSLLDRDGQLWRHSHDTETASAGGRARSTGPALRAVRRTFEYVKGAYDPCQ
jgi:hypothetical protein